MSCTVQVAGVAWVAQVAWVVQFAWGAVGMWELHRLHELQRLHELSRGSSHAGVAWVAQLRLQEFHKLLRLQGLLRLWELHDMSCIAPQPLDPELQVFDPLNPRRKCRKEGLDDELSTYFRLFCSKRFWKANRSWFTNTCK